MRQRHAKRFTDNLSRGRCPQKLTAAPGTGACAATKVRCLLQRYFTVGEARADGLNLACVLTYGGRQGDASGDEHAGQIMHRRKRHHHRGQALVAGRHA